MTLFVHPNGVDGQDNWCSVAFTYPERRGFVRREMHVHTFLRFETLFPDGFKAMHGRAVE